MSFSVQVAVILRDLADRLDPRSPMRIAGHDGPAIWQGGETPPRALAEPDPVEIETPIRQRRTKTRTPGLHPNVAAFLDMIAVAEGTACIGDDGYNVIIGSTAARPDLFHDYRTHPNKLVAFRYSNGAQGHSTAAGRYQILHRYAVHYMRQLGLPDFSPESQDAIALQLIRECRAMDDITAGRLDEAVRKCRSRWASLPGAGYGQHEQPMARLRAAFVDHGGRVA